ncbi:MAG: hypothetical protein LBL16_00210 [Endomicrobium sp.]|nr:hypothetical protein [Endomicrobium sp.]
MYIIVVYNISTFKVKERQTAIGSLLDLTPALTVLDFDTNCKILKVIDLIKSDYFMFRYHLYNILDLANKNISNDTVKYLGEIYIKILSIDKAYLDDSEFKILELLIKYKQREIIEEIKTICTQNNNYRVLDYIDKNLKEDLC